MTLACSAMCTLAKPRRPGAHLLTPDTVLAVPLYRIRLPRDREQVQLSMVSGVMGRRNSKMLVNRASTRRTHLLRSVASGSVNGDHSSSASSTAKQVTLPRDASDTSKSSFRSHTRFGKHFHQILPLLRSPPCLLSCL